METNLAAWGAELGRIIEETGWTMRSLAEQLGVTPSTVSNWVAGKHEPTPEVAFRVEAELGLDPGSLSFYLGYVPVDGSVPSVLAAIRADPLLEEHEKAALRLAYTSLTRGRR